MGNKNTGKVWVVIPAAGVGQRMKSDTPKQYLSINDKTIIQHTLACFIGHSDIAGVVIALGSEDSYWNQQWIKFANIPVYTVEGGSERHDSVSNALEYLLTVEQVDTDSWVMVHDAARPCLSQQDLNQLLELRSTDSVGGILASPVKDTMKRTSSKNKNIIKTESRENLWHALTPQMFRLGQLSDALKHCFNKGITVTDDASAIEAMGEFPTIVEGCSSNIKITNPVDLTYVDLILSRGDNA